MEKSERLKFKKLTKNDKYYIEGEFFSNRVFLFKRSWVAGLKKRESRQLRNMLQFTQVKYFQARMTGEVHFKAPLTQIVELAASQEYKEVDLSKCKAIKGYKYGKAGQKEKVAYQIGGKHGPYLDIEYFAAFSFEPGLTCKILGQKDPVLILKGDEIVGMLMPLDPSYLVQNKKGKI